MNDFSLGYTIATNNGKPTMVIIKKISNEQEIKILCRLLLEKGEIMVPLKIEDKLRFYAQLKEKKII